MPADPKTSAGARLERKAFRAYLRRRMGSTTQAGELAAVLAWVLARQARYDKRGGGLGK